MSGYKHRMMSTNEFFLLKIKTNGQLSNGVKIVQKNNDNLNVAYVSTYDNCNFDR